MSIVIRPAAEADQSFIRDSWRKSLWKNVVDRDIVTWDDFFDGMNDLWDTIDPRALYTVAEFKDVPGEILGYAVHLSEQNCLWVYVKKPYRRQGIGTALLRGATRLGTITPLGKKLAHAVGASFDVAMHYRKKP